MSLLFFNLILLRVSEIAYMLYANIYCTKCQFHNNSNLNVLNKSKSSFRSAGAGLNNRAWRGESHKRTKKTSVCKQWKIEIARTPSTMEHTEQIITLIDENPHFIIQQVADTLGISLESVQLHLKNSGYVNIVQMCRYTSRSQRI